MKDQVLKATSWHARSAYSDMSADLNEPKALSTGTRTVRDISADKIPVTIRVLRMKQVSERTGLSRSTVYELMKHDPTFPSKVRLSARTTGLLESDLETWIMSRTSK